MVENTSGFTVQPLVRKLRTGNGALLAKWRIGFDSIQRSDFADYDTHSQGLVLRSCFGLHPSAMQDAQRDRHSPRLDALTDNVFMLLKGLAAPSR
jgi:magnesium transporter